MKRIIFFFTLLSMIGGTVTPTRAQEVATLTGEPLLRSAIVRQYIDNTNIHYCSDINGNHYFVLYQHASPTNAIVANFPSNLEVHDFEVFEKNVYFCGTSPNGGNPYGMVGQISIYDLFYNNGPYNIGILQNSYMDTLPLASHLASCDRMDVFKRGGHVHLAIVGELELGSTYGGTLRRTACDIWFNGTDWTGSMLYQKNDLYKTSDITCTEQAVVVSAYDNDSSYVLLLAFNKVAGFPSYPISPLSIKLQDQRADNNILIERLSGDDVTPYVLFSIGPFDNSILKINQKGVLDYPNPDNHTVSVICEQ